MYKRSKKKFNGNVFVFGVIIFCLVLSFVFMRFNINLPGLFLKDGFLAVDSFFTSVFHMDTDYNALKDENESLKVQLESYKELESKNIELLNEVNKLKEVTHISELVSDGFYVNGTVINRDFDFWQDKLLINIGSNDGVLKDMAVVSNGTLIGVTDDVSSNSSSVILLCNYKFPFNISVKINVEGKYVYGILNSYDSNNRSFSVVGVVDNISIPDGSLVYTSGFGNIFPSGLLVGSVSSIETDNFDLSKIIVVNSLIDFDDISYVSVVGRNG